MKKYINLLPPSEQQAIRLADRQTKIITFGVWLVLSVVALSAGLFAGRMVFQAKLRVSVAEVVSARGELQQLRSSTLLSQVGQLNLDLQNFQILTGSKVLGSAPSEVLMEIGRILPADVTLDSLTLGGNPSGVKEVELAGRAGTRKSVLRLRENLVKSDRFSNVNFPLRNLEKSQDTQWKYKFYIR